MSEFMVIFEPAHPKVAISAAPWDGEVSEAALTEALRAYNEAVQPDGVLGHLYHSHGVAPVACAGRILRGGNTIVEVELPEVEPVRFEPLTAVSLLEMSKKRRAA